MSTPDFSYGRYLPPLNLQTYERYLPTAFDESLSLLEKMNKLIYFYNLTGEVTNDLIKRWNELVEWVVGHGLHDTLQKIINDMLEDGRFGEVFLSLPKNVRYYGAYGDGVADDADAIQKALDGGGRVYIPIGSYRMTHRLVIPADTHLEVHPQARLIFDGDDYCMIQNGRQDDCGCYTKYNGNGNITIDGGFWDCGGSTKTNIRGGVFLGHGSNITLKNMRIANVKESHFIEINSSENVTVDKCIFQNFMGGRTFSEAIQIDAALNAENFPPFGEYDGTYCRHIVIKDCYFQKVGAGVGTHVTSPLKWHEDVVVKDCFFDGLMSHAIHFMNFKEFVIEGNKGTSGQSGVILEGCYEGTVQNNFFSDMSGNGFQLRNCEHIKVVDNTAKRCANGFTGYENTRDIVVTGNRLESNTANGINFTGGTNNRIETNAIVKNSSYGVFLHDAADFNIVRDNRIEGNALSGVAITNASTNRVLDNIVTGNATSGTLNNIDLLAGSTKNELRNNYVRKSDGQAGYGIAVNGSAANDNRIIDNDVDTTAFAQKSYVVDREWKTLTLTNGWRNYDSGVPLQYQIRGNKVVFRGILTPGTLGGTDNDETMAFKLPGLASPRQANFPIAGGIGGSTTDFARVNFFPSGRCVVPVTNGLTAIDFNSIEVTI